jgi:hypothetical protein
MIQPISGGDGMASTIKNILVVAGAYYLSLWIAPPVALLFGKATRWIHYEGAFAAAVLLPLVVSMPFAFVAGWVGAIIAFLVESKRPVLWAFLPAALYAGFSYCGQSWVRPPTASDRVAQIIGSLFPAASCIAGAPVGLRQRKYTAGAAN